jgi:hypothetical protein
MALSLDQTKQPEDSKGTKDDHSWAGSYEDAWRGGGGGGGGAGGWVHR